MTKDHRFEDVYNDSVEEGGVQNMCEILDRVEQRGERRGIMLGEQRGERRGIMLGEQRGIAMGVEEQARKAALNLQRMGMKPADIAAALEQPLDKVIKWLACAEQQ